MKKHLGLHHRRLNVHKNFLSFHHKADVVPVIGKGVAPVLLDRVVNQMGGLLIGDTNVVRGGKINKAPPRRPIRFLV